jgi:hypothetical protein
MCGNGPNALPKTRWMGREGSVLQGNTRPAAAFYPQLASFGTSGRPWQGFSKERRVCTNTHYLVHFRHIDDFIVGEKRPRQQDYHPCGPKNTESE